MLTTVSQVTNQVSSGLAAIFGAGLLVGLAPAASVAGWWLLAGLVLAAGLTVLCGLSGSDSRAWVPATLGRIFGAAAIASASGLYLLPSNPKLAAVGVLAAAVVLVTLGFRPPAKLVGMAVGVVLAVLVVFVVACLTIAPPRPAIAPPPGDPGTGDLMGLPVAIVLMFFCFLGFERASATGRRAPILITIGIALVVHLAVAGAALRQLGGARLALSSAPLRDALAAADASGLSRMLSAGVAVATLLALLGVLTDLRDTHGRLLVPVAGVAAAGPVLLLPVPVSIAVAAGLMLLHYAMSAPFTRRRRARGSVTPPSARP
jgi:APA family basic amino acid/polyamine antiporter